MLTAKVGESIVNCFDRKYDRYRLKQWSSKGILKCPVCDDTYEYCHGEIVSPYFRHVGKECDGYYSESETDEHRNGKVMLYKWIKGQDGVTNCQLEAWIPETKQRPDIYFEYNGKRFVIEYQCTPIASEFLIRRELYKLAGITDIWILGTEKYSIEVNQNNNPVHVGRYKTIEKSDFLYFDINKSSFYIAGKLIKEKLLHKVLILNDYYSFNINKMDFVNEEIFIKEDILQEYMENDKQRYALQQKEKNFKHNLIKNLKTITNDLNSFFKEEEFSFDPSTSLYHLGKITYYNLTFFIHKEEVDVCRKYLKSVPFRGKRGGLGWEKRTFYHQLQTMQIDISDNKSIFDSIQQYVLEIKNKEEIEKLEKQREIKEKYYPVFGEFLNKEIILIHQGKQDIPEGVRFKFLKGFNIFDEYMEDIFLKELKFLRKKNVNRYVFMIPKYHNYFNNMGFSGYVRVGEFNEIIKKHFNSYGFDNVKFINEKEEAN